MLAERGTNTTVKRETTRILDSSKSPDESKRQKILQDFQRVKDELKAKLDDLNTKILEVENSISLFW